MRPPLGVSCCRQSDCRATARGEVISKLNLSRKRLGALAGCLLSELIVCNSTIETLDLSANMLGQREDAACHAISDALKARPVRMR